MRARPARLKQIWARLTPSQRSQVLSEEYTWQHKNRRRASVGERLRIAERVLAQSFITHEPLGSEGGSHVI
jgi:hypothetical protein